MRGSILGRVGLRAHVLDRDPHWESAADKGEMHKSGKRQCEGRFVCCATCMGVPMGGLSYVFGSHYLT